MKRSIVIFLMLVLFCVDIYAQGIAALKNDPQYIKIENEVMFLRAFSAHMRQAAARGARYGAGIGGVLGIPEGLAEAARQTGEKMMKREFTARSPQEIIAKTHAYWVVTGVINPIVYAGVYSLRGAAYGALLGATIGEVKRRYILWKIQSALQLYTTYNFNTMPMPAATLVLATYQKNKTLMQKIKPYVRGFVNSKAVLQALTQLYFGKVTPSNTKELQAILI
jgi:hypothetical protein